MSSLDGKAIPPILVSSSLIVLLFYAINRYLALRRNIKLAQEISLPYIVLPFYTSTLPWLILGPLVIPILRACLPSFVNQKWIDYMLAFWTWYLGYEPFEKYGSDTIMTVAPGGITFWTCSPEIISQIGARGRDFPKPVEYYKVLDIFGSNILSSTGPNWRRQRKGIAPSFNESNNALVWDEAVFQTTSMLQSWTIESKYKSVNFQEDFKMLAFHVLSRGGFGVRLLWAGNQEVVQSNPFASDLPDKNPLVSPSASMGLGEAMLCVVENMKEIFVFPNWFLRYAPSKMLNKSWFAHKEVTRYMNGFMSEKRDSIEKAETDIFSSLFANSHKKPSVSRYSEDPLTEKEIIANVFATMVAGHETTGSTLFHVLIMLAVHPAWQREMQADLDHIFEGRDPTTWTYTEDIEKLLRSSVDAVISETLRLYPPANLVPKRTSPGPPQILKYKNREICIPGDTRINILVASTHRNPNYYPTNPHPFGLGTDINEFKPSRWFATTDKTENNLYAENPYTFNRQFSDSSTYSSVSLASTNTDTNSCFTSDTFNSSSTTSKFFKPAKGAFIPFSIGQRECIGKRFAHIEMLVVLAVIFRSFSVELVVEGEAGLSMGKKWMAWEDEREKVRGALKDGMEHYMTMQLGKGLCPMKIVKRGQEKFASMT